MPRAHRVQLIQQIEQIRGSRVLVLFTGDRANLETRIAMDLVPLVARHLRGIGKQDKIDLFLYTLGGDVMAGYRIVNLIREYCAEEFTVMVPFRCQSTGTLIALGADRVYMLPESQLSPVDPSTNGPYNPVMQGVPTAPGTPQPTLPVSVEEVVSYINMAREVSDLKGEESLTRVFERLTNDVRPLALGQVYRARTQIRMLSRKLLQSHMGAEDPAIDSLVETLTEKLYSHDYLITRREAKAIGLKVVEPPAPLEQALAALYDLYEADLKLRQPFNPVAALAQAMPGPNPPGVLAGPPQPPQVQLSEDRAFIESVGRCDVFNTEQILRRHPQGIEAVPLHEGWKTVP